MWDYVKRPNLRLTGVPEEDEENESKLENTLQDIIQELPQPNKTGHHSNSGNPENPSKMLHEKINPKTHIHQILQGQNEGKNVKGSHRERPGHLQREAHQTNSRLLSRNPISQNRLGTNTQHSFFFLMFYWILGFGVHGQSMQDSCVGTHMAVRFSFLLPFTHIWHFSPGYPSPPPPPTGPPLFPPIDPSV